MLEKGELDGLHRSQTCSQQRTGCRFWTCIALFVAIPCQHRLEEYGHSLNCPRISSHPFRPLLFRDFPIFFRFHDAKTRDRGGNSLPIGRQTCKEQRVLAVATRSLQPSILRQIIFAHKTTPARLPSTQSTAHAPWFAERNAASPRLLRRMMCCTSV